MRVISVSQLSFRGTKLKGIKIQFRELSVVAAACRRLRLVLTHRAALML